MSVHISSSKEKPSNLYCLLLWEDARKYVVSLGLNRSLRLTDWCLRARSHVEWSFVWLVPCLTILLQGIYLWLAVVSVVDGTGNGKQLKQNTSVIAYALPS